MEAWIRVCLLGIGGVMVGYSKTQNERFEKYSALSFTNVFQQMKLRVG
jgi:hypothetical protein